MHINLKLIETGRLGGFRLSSDSDVLFVDNRGLPKAGIWVLEGSTRTKFLELENLENYLLTPEGVLFKQKQIENIRLKKFGEEQASIYKHSIILGESGVFFKGFYLCLETNEYDDSYLVSTDLSNGNRYHIDDWLFQPIMTSNKLIYREFNRVFALSPNLELQWEYKIAKNYSHRFRGNSNLNQLKKAKELIIFPAGYDSDRNITQIIALEPSDGSEVWKVELDDSPSYFTIINGLCYVSMPNRFLIIDESTGSFMLDIESFLENKYFFIPLKSKLLAVSREDSSIYLYNSDASTLIDKVCIKNYTFNVASTFVINNDKLYLCIESEESYMNLAYSGYAVISITDNGVDLQIQKRPMQILKTVKDEQSIYQINIDTNEKEDLLRYVEIGIREIACRYGSSEVNQSPERDIKHKGDIVVNYQSNQVSNDIKSEVKNMVTQLLPYIQDDINIYPGAGNGSQFRFNVEFSSEL